MSSVVGGVEGEQKKEDVGCHWGGTRKPGDRGRKDGDDEAAYKPSVECVGNWSQSTAYHLCDSEVE